MHQVLAETACGRQPTRSWSVRVACTLSGVHLLLSWRLLQILLSLSLLHLFVTFKLHVFALGFLFNPQFDLEPEYIIRKPPLRRIQRYILRREILSTFHTWVDNRSIRHVCIVFTPKLPLPLRRSPPKSSTPLPSPTPLTTPNGIPIHLRVWPLLTCADRQMVQAKVP